MRLLDVIRSAMQRKTSLVLHNTLTKADDLFTLPPVAKQVRMYNCGPTVYGKQHIGNLSMFVFTDILRRTLEWNNFSVDQVINITDVGHLQSDADAGEDKMTLGLQRDGLPLTLDNMKVLAEKYASLFFDDLSLLGIDISRIRFPRASDYIAADIAMIQTLQEKGYAYTAIGGVYYDTVRFPAYGKLGTIDLTGQLEGARVALTSEKRNPTDFLLWKSDVHLGWDSPWGMGFPGWHIECSAMIRSTLGRQIDIHTGGIEHIPIHHNNEIAQSEVATGRTPLSRFWMHRAHIQINGGKIAKSQGNVVYLSDIIERRFHPLSLRYLFLQAHYRSPSNFSWEALSAAQTAFANLLSLTAARESSHAAPSSAWIRRFTQRINNDLDTPGALAVLWDMTKDRKLSPAVRYATLVKMDHVLGLNIETPDAAAMRLIRTELALSEVPADIQSLIAERTEARKTKDWKRADEVRTSLETAGYEVEDTNGATRIFRKY